MQLADRLGWAALVMTFVGIGTAILWPTKRWIGWLCLVCALALGIVWGYSELKDHHSISKETVNPQQPASTTTPPTQQLPQSPPSPSTSPSVSSNPQRTGTKKAPVRTAAQDNSVHVENGSKIEQQSSGPCSPNIIGGSNSVNCGPPPLQLNWSVLDVTPPQLSDEKHEFKYEKQVKVMVNESYTPVSLGVVCDAEIKEITAHVATNLAEMHLNPRFGLDHDNKKVGFAYFEGTPVTPDSPLFISIWSDTLFTVREVRQAKINF